VASETVPSDPAERAASGKAARADRPRSGHAELGDLTRDPVAILTSQNEARVLELVPIRHARMLASPFAFFRGAAAVMAADLAETPGTPFEVQLCGDAHLSNFGVFSAPDRRLVFDCNDFDETCPGPFEWDVKRLVASVAIAGRQRGFGKKERHRAVLDTAAAYRTAIREYAAMRNLEVWYSRIDVEPALESLRAQADEDRLRRVERNLQKARAKDSIRAYGKLTEEVDEGVRIRGEPPLIVPVEELAAGEEVERQLREVVASYGESLSPDRRHLLDSYRYVHAARKVVGVGSVGTRAWIVLLLGRDGSDPLFLQAKEAGVSVLEPYAGASVYSHHGRRVVEGQRLMQAASDIFLGWVTVTGVDGIQRSFYVRQLWDGKGSADVEALEADELATYGTLCGRALARAHARSGDRVAIAAYLGGGTAFDEALGRFASSYADRNEEDFEQLREAAASGRIEVGEDPA
jgi:uncharacterized protein (DUF2252 family)